MAFARRHLPHWIPDDSTIFVTCRLAGSAPPTKREPGHIIGPLWLQDPRIAGIVKDALLYGEGVRHFYRLDAWVIMPNHVHAIWQPRVSMPVIMRWLKGRTSRTSNRILGRTGRPFWQDESFDHWIRSTDELQSLIAYVENNPVKSGLAATPDQWPWTSAGRPTGDGAA
jgi:putative transposase